MQEIAETSASAMECEIVVNGRFGEQKELDFATPLNVILPPPRRDAKQKDLFFGLEERQNKEAAN